MATLDERISTTVGSWRWPPIPTVNFTCAGHSSPRVRVNSEHTSSQSAMPLDTYYAELPVTDCAHRLVSRKLTSLPHADPATLRKMRLMLKVPWSRAQ